MDEHNLEFVDIDDRMWTEFNKLEGLWANRDDMDDDWLNTLRDSWDDSFKNIWIIEK